MRAELITNQTPDVVLGQPDFTTVSEGTSRLKHSQPHYIFSDGEQLIIADHAENHRILVYNSIPAANFAPADIVIGQPNFTENGVGSGPQGFSSPVKAMTDGKNLYVSDKSNHRVLIFNIGDSAIDLSPQFEQGKAVLGKVFWDLNGNGRQDRVLPSLRGYSPETVIAR
ncbi:MAG: hypothetical protein A3G87_08925 [Omnitrophica bacterium RIFCSPLOWO2_12_FULL_50_11]|nr:MAG: hypothetical protein A3G87_08925 [Omnitrophica bacterium RIFCSPLOWO2_12_FULL_50_11]